MALVINKKLILTSPWLSFVGRKIVADKLKEEQDQLPESPVATENEDLAQASPTLKEEDVTNRMQRLNLFFKKQQVSQEHTAMRDKVINLITFRKLMPPTSSLAKHICEPNVTKSWR